MKHHVTIRGNTKRDHLVLKSELPSRVKLIGDFEGIWSLCLNVQIKIKQQKKASPNHFLHLPLMSIVIVGCCVRVAPPLHVSESGGIRATGLILQPLSWTSSQGDRRSKKPEGGRGTQAKSRRTEPTTSSQSPGVAAPCPSVQNTPLPSQSQTF